MNEGKEKGSADLEPGVPSRDLQRIQDPHLAVRISFPAGISGPADDGEPRRHLIRAQDARASWVLKAKVSCKNYEWPAGWQRRDWHRDQTLPAPRRPMGDTLTGAAPKLRMAGRISLPRAGLAASSPSCSISVGLARARLRARLITATCTSFKHDSDWGREHESTGADFGEAHDVWDVCPATRKESPLKRRR